MEIPPTIISNCHFHNFTSFPRKQPLYTCTILEINASSTSNFQHIADNTNDDVKIVRFLRTRNCPRLPKNLKSIFPSIDILIVNDCKFSELTRDDLIGLQLTDLIVEHTPIYQLSADLLKNQPQLEVVMFHDTKLSSIEPAIFDHLRTLRAVYLVNSPTINAVFAESMDLSLSEDFGEHTKTPSIAELKKVIKGCSPCDNVCMDIKKLLASDNFKDFTVTIKESCCHDVDCSDKCCNEVLNVHKFLLAARSPVLAQLIRKNPDASNLNLIDIPRYAFKIVIDYFYNGIIPSDPYLNMKDLFSAADKLGLTELRIYARNEILRQNIKELNGDRRRNEEFVDKAKRLRLIGDGCQMTRSLDGRFECKEAGRMAKSLLCGCEGNESVEFDDFIDLSDYGNDAGKNSKTVDSDLKNVENSSDLSQLSLHLLGSDPNNLESPKKSTETSDPTTDSNITVCRPKTPRPSPENLNYKNANQNYSLTMSSYSDSIDLNDSDCSDFVKIELEDQYEIIGDFYDEVCSMETERME